MGSSVPVTALTGPGVPLELLELMVSSATSRTWRRCRAQYAGAHNVMKKQYR